MEHHGWNVIDEEAGILYREYCFTGKALATTLVFRGQDGLVVVSPATGLTSADYEALSDFGPVTALIANNTFHHLGQKSWRQHFKDAQSYAPPNACKTLSKKAPGIPFRSLTELQLPTHVNWEDPPGFKTGEALLRVKSKGGSIWYTGDLLTNITALPPPPMRWIFTWTGSGPGYRLFLPVVWLMVQDRKALQTWALSWLAKDPPTIVVPAHGKPVDVADLVAQTKEQLARL